MIVFLLALLVLVIGAVVAVVLGRTGRMSVEMAEPARSQAPLMLPDGPLGPGDLAAVRFDRAVRGYRMDQVDDLLDRLRLQLGSSGTYAGAQVTDTQPDTPRERGLSGTSPEPDNSRERGTSSQATRPQE